MAHDHATHHHAPKEHRQAAPKRVRVYVITVSDTRNEETDKSGSWLKQAVLNAGHEMVGYQIVKDEEDQVVAAMEVAHGAGAQIILTNGGTGIAHRDRTYEAIQSRLEKELAGFGELFRMRSFEFVGAAAMLSRATAGLWKGHFVACLPGSTGAVRLAWEELLEPELGHLAFMASGD
jgi:molybdenum cofactor biosynthesis protein B